MKILATRQFVRAARRAPGPLRHIQELVWRTRPSEAARASELGGGRVLGLTRGRGLLKLWYYLPREVNEQEEPPLATLPRSDLRGLGLDRRQIDDAQRALSLEELEELGLQGQPLDRLRFLFLQAAAGQEEDDTRLVCRAMDTMHLSELLEGKITDLLLNLDPSQQRVVDLPGGGTIVVQGVAGSGKTSVLLHRVCRLLRGGTLLEPRTMLLLTFNRSLANAARELLDALGGEETRGVEVQTLHRWCMGHAGVRAGRLMGTAERRQRLAAAVRDAAREGPDSAVWRSPLSFWEDEVHRIKGRGVQREDAYLRMQRVGAQRPLGPGPRRAVWRAFEGFVRLCREAGKLDWDDVVSMAHHRLQQRGVGAPRYDHVFLDEAQDLTVMGIRVAALLAREPGELFVGYDPAQSIYERGFRWKDAGVKVHGSRSFAFHRNYRNTRQILDAARPVLAAVRREQAGDARDLVDGEVELLEPEAAARSGPTPRHLNAEPWQEPEAMAAEIRTLLRHRGVRPGNIAVLCYPNRVKQRVFEGLQQRDILCQMHHSDSEIRLADPSVKVLPMKSAKGLEFPVVLVVAAGRCFRQPHSEMDALEVRAWTAEMRRLFYVAMTRAMSELILVYPRLDPPPFLRTAGDGKG